MDDEKRKSRGRSRPGASFPVADGKNMLPGDYATVLKDLKIRIQKELVVEYALRGFKSPMGVAEWEMRLSDSLPEELKGSLPSIEQIQAELKDKI